MTVRVRSNGETFTIIDVDGRTLTFHNAESPSLIDQLQRKCGVFIWECKSCGHYTELRIIPPTTCDGCGRPDRTWIGKKP